MNNVEIKMLDVFININVDKDIIYIMVIFFQMGQYGFDIYGCLKEVGENIILFYVMKYFINCLKVINLVDILKILEKQIFIKKEKWGLQLIFEFLGIKIINFKELKIILNDFNMCIVEIFVFEDVVVIYQFFKELDVDVKDCVVMVFEKGGMIKYYVDFLQTGNYMLSLFG